MRPMSRSEKRTTWSPVSRSAMPTRAGRGGRGRVPPSPQLRLFRCNRIANADGAAGGHLGIDPAFGVTEAAHQRVRDVEVARRGLRIDVGGGAAHDPLYDLEPDVADGKGLAEQLELVPCRPAADIEVGTESQRVNR